MGRVVSILGRRVMLDFRDRMDRVDEQVRSGELDETGQPPSDAPPAPPPERGLRLVKKKKAEE